MSVRRQDENVLAARRKPVLLSKKSIGENIIKSTSRATLPLKAKGEETKRDDKVKPVKERKALTALTNGTIQPKPSVLSSKTPVKQSGTRQVIPSTSMKTAKTPMKSKTPIHPKSTKKINIYTPSLNTRSTEDEIEYMPPKLPTNSHSGMEQLAIQDFHSDPFTLSDLDPVISPDLDIDFQPDPMDGLIDLKPLEPDVDHVDLPDFEFDF